MTLRFSNLTKFGVWVFAVAAVVHALNDILTDSESDSDELLYSIIEDSYYTWRNSQDVLNAKKDAGSSCISIAVFIVVLLVALLIGSGSALGVGYFFYKKKMTAKEEEIQKVTKQIGDKEKKIKALTDDIDTLNASSTNAAGPSNSGDAPDPTEIARLKGEVQNQKNELEGLRDQLKQAGNHPPPPAGPPNQDLEDAKTENVRLVNLVADLTRQLNEALGLENNAPNAANLPDPSPLPAGASDQNLENDNAKLQEHVDELTGLLQAARQANNDFDEKLQRANDDIDRLFNLNEQLREQLAPPNDHVSTNEIQSPPIPPQRTAASMQSPQSQLREFGNVQPMTNDPNDLNQFHPENDDHTYSPGQHGDESMHLGQSNPQDTGYLGAPTVESDMNGPANGIDTSGRLDYGNNGHIQGSGEHGEPNAFHLQGGAQQFRNAYVAPPEDSHVPANGIGAQPVVLTKKNLEDSLGYFIHDNEGFIEEDRFHSVMKTLYAISSISSWFFISLEKMVDSTEALRCKVASFIHYRTIKLMLKTTRLNPQLLPLLVPHLVLEFMDGAGLLSKLIIQLPEVDLKSLLSKVPNLFQEIGTKFAEMVMHMPNDDLKILIRRMSLKPIETIKLQFEKALPQLMEKRAHRLASLLQLEEEDDKPISESLSKSLKKVIKEGTTGMLGKSKSPALVNILSNIYTHSTATTDDLTEMLEELLKMNPTASKLKEAIPAELLTSSSDEVVITINE